MARTSTDGLGVAVQAAPCPPSPRLLSPPCRRDCIWSPLSLSRSCRSYVDGPHVDRWPPRCGAGGPSPPPPARSSFPWRRHCVRSMPLRGGVTVAASIARAVAWQLGFAATAMYILFPPIPSSTTMALNVNECGTACRFSRWSMRTYSNKIFNSYFID